MKVSILIPTYQQEQTLVQAVESALSQIYPDLEVIVSDDRSSDGSIDSLSKFANDPRLQIYRNEVNLGRVDNYRRALRERARGDWVLNLDGDDYLASPDYVSRAMALVGSDPSVVLVFANVESLIDATGDRRRSDCNSRLKNGVMEGDELFLRLATEPIALYHATCLYRRDLAIELDFYRADILSSDWESLYRLILCGRVGFLEMIAAVWRRHAESATKVAKFEARAENLERILGPFRYARSLRRFSNRELRDWLRGMLYRDARNTLKRLDGPSDVGRARAYFLEILRLSPRAGLALLGRPQVWRALLLGSRTKKPEPGTNANTSGNG